MSARVVLRPRKARPLFSRHPWLFERSIARVEGKPRAGEGVEVVTDEGEFVAHGLFNPNSQIRVRLYSWDESQPVDESLIARRIEEAIDFRHNLLGLAEPNRACRLVYSESDGLSGLVIDRFANVAVVQFNALGMLQFESTVRETLARRIAPSAIVRRVDRSIAERDGITSDNEVIWGALPQEPAPVEESGVVFHVDPIQGQKTGAFLDQRENRLAVARYAKGRDVLDVFCYTGGFGLVALARGGARSVLGVDSSAEAIAAARRNAGPFGPAAEFRQGDASAVLTELARSGRRFGVVVCDPPKFANKSADLAGAMRGYEHINRLAISLVEPGGFLATSSCSGLVTSEAFLAMLATASLRQKREVRVLEIRGQAADHPISLYCPETAYLKCVIARVMP